MTNCYSILVDEASVWSIPRLACPCGLCSCLIDETFGRHSVNCQFDNQSEVLFKIIGSSELAMEIEEDNIWVIWLYNLRGCMCRECLLTIKGCQ